MSPALADGFVATVLPGKSLCVYLAVRVSRVENGVFVVTCGVFSCSM